MLAIGLMSGTSLDGMDACLVDIDEANKSFKIKKAITYHYSDEFREELKACLNNNTARLANISGLNFKIGEKSNEAIDYLLKDSGYTYQDISFVASHGQTIWHDPLGVYYPTPSTLQIGEASVINYHTGIKVISNFRCKDVAAGGTGAPLVPFALHYLYSNDCDDILFQNIGGIGNLTYLKAKGSIDETIAFDTGVGNCMIDYFMNKYFDLPYDDKGIVALSGVVISSILDELMKDDYLKIIPPKATGKERYSKEYFEEIAKRFSFADYPKQDIIATITEYTVQTFIYSYNHYVGPFSYLVVTGGGAHNEYIMKRLSSSVDARIFTGDEFYSSTDYLEALAFVVLGYQTLMRRTSNVPSVTNARKKVILGSITE